MDLFYHLKDRIHGKAPKGAKRSSKWRKVRNEFVKENPKCAVCGSTKKLEVHHILPYHLFPELELETDNLITLCDGGGLWGVASCHRFFGHLGRWSSMNPTIKEDAFIWSRRLNGDDLSDDD